MEERINFRANFSNITTPKSSGGRQEDSEGNEYATIPLQLPNNLISNQRRPRKVELQLTKMSIPIGRIPVSQIDIDTVVTRPYSGRILTQIVTKGVMTIWPFRFDGYGNVRGDYTPLFYQAPGGSPSSSFAWYTSALQIDVNGQRGTAAYDEKIKTVSHEKVWNFESVDEVCQFLTKGIQLCIYTLLRRYNPDNFPNRVFYPQFVPSGENIALKMENRGSIYTILPVTNEVFETSLVPRTGGTRTFARTVDANNSTTNVYDGSSYIYGFSIVVNRYVRDMLPALPWRIVDNRTLTPFNSATGEGTQIARWADQNYGDPYFYVLDTTTAEFSVQEDQVRSAYNSTTGESLVTADVLYSFNNFALISMVPVTSFIVTLEGIGMTQQVFPVNINVTSESAGTTTVVPIIETYYPLWETIKDTSTNLVVIKDQFSNAAPIVADASALFERNIRFSVYYIDTKGRMTMLKIPPNTVLSFQVCFSILY